MEHTFEELKDSIDRQWSSADPQESAVLQAKKNVLLSLVSRLQQDYNLREAQYHNLAREIGELREWVEGVQRDKNRVYEELDDRIDSLEDDVIDFKQVTKYVPDNHHEINKIDNELAGLWNEITDLLSLLPVKEHPDYLHSMANFIAGRDIARMRELRNELKVFKEEYNYGNA